MSRKEQHPGGVKLTAKTARTLAMQEFGTTRGLTKSTSFVGAYFMEFGNLRIEICADAACIAVRVVLAHGTGSSVKYFDPDTLQENFKAIDCTAAERLEIEFSYEFYKAALEEEMERFYSAFLMKNDIFPPASKKAEEIPAAEISRSEALKLQALMAGMGDHTRRPVLGSGVEP